MSITIEQVNEAIASNPDLKQGIISSLKDDFLKSAPEGVIVRTKEEDQQYLESQLNVLLPGKVDEKFNEKFRERLEAIDNEITTITGEKKGPHEKTTEFVKRVTASLKNKGADPVTKEKITQLEEMLANTKNEYEQKLTAAEQSLFNREIEWQVNAELDKVNVAVPVHLKTDEQKQAYINQQKALIKQGFLNGFQPKKDEQGNVVFYEGDKPLMSDKDGKPKSAGSLISERYSAWFVPQGQHVTGTGVTPINTTGFTDKASIHSHLATMGLDVGSKEYMDQFEKIANDNKIKI